MTINDEIGNLNKRGFISQLFDGDSTVAEYSLFSIKKGNFALAYGKQTWIKYWSDFAYYFLAPVGTESQLAISALARFRAGLGLRLQIR